MNEFWKEDGEPHFQDEEMILFPIYLIYAEEPDEALVKKLSINTRRSEAW